MFDFLVGSYLHSEIQASVMTRHLTAKEAKLQAFRKLCEFKGVPEARDETELRECLLDMLAPEEQAEYRQLSQLRVKRGIACFILGVAGGYGAGCLFGNVLGGFFPGLLVWGLSYWISGDFFPEPPDLLMSALREYESAHKATLKAKCAKIQAARMAQNDPTNEDYDHDSAGMAAKL
jgi:hypothetical protein